MQYGFYFDSSRCIECYACEIACKAEHDLAPSVNEKPGVTAPRWRRVSRIEDFTQPDKSAQYISLSCMHCGKPACMEVCPVGAISKRAENGIVVVDSDECVGCRSCFDACPFGIPQYGPDGTMQKCNLCLERLEAGEKPACVANCSSGALLAGPIDKLSEIARTRKAQRLAGATQPSVFITLP
ncbi:MAG: 4Fe-4S dicluster domain-containing protein [Desulfobulbaceae bacterium]|nr:4Fe-4S dicluster domain-containing protein [Desulfobulbaceae bacterium]